jgi:DNA-binding NtrC family response regulator
VKDVDEQTTVREDDQPSSVPEARLGLTLVGLEEGAGEARAALSRERPLLVGRQAGSEGLSVRDVKMSRAHFKIAWDGRSRAFRIEDQQTRNGTYLKGAPLESGCVRPGDVIRAGDSLFVCHVLADDGEAERQAQAARSGVPILIMGETGTGKERLARGLHEQSGRSPLVPVNCGAIPRDLVASELFGHVRGAFSGATAARAGLFVAADGGTLFLDEVCELPLELQPALLRALDDGRIRGVGSEQETAVDVRVIAATNADAEGQVRVGKFRPDLYARLAGLVLTLRSLRERREEILEIAGVIAREEGVTSTFGADALEALLLWDWPYNVRELKSLMRALRAFLGDSERVSLEHVRSVRAELVARVAERRAGAAGPSSVPAPGRAELAELLERYGGNVSAVAEHTGRSRAAVYRWMRRVGLSTTERPDKT